MSEKDHKYWAFISYSHQDEAWAQWLHRALEKYAIPKGLVGRALGDTQIPKRLFPVYRDREELSSASDLGAALNRALLQSRNLIVVCSPRSATSRWVNEEIRSFRALGRGGRIFCLIVDGEPYATNKPEIAFSECFPPALRAASDDGSAFEPIAADARERKDGKQNAKLKLIAGLLGVGFDELKQREKQRQFWQRVQTAAVAVALAALLAGVWQWFQHKRVEREREITIEKLVENGRLELLDGHQARAAVYLNEAYKMGNDSVPVRFMLGQAMQPVESLTKVRVRHGSVGADAFGATFSPDGKKFVLVSNKVEDDHERAVAKLYDAATGSLLAKLPDAPPLPVMVEFLPDKTHLLITGYPDTDAAGMPATHIWDLQSPGTPLRVEGMNGGAGEPLHPGGTRFVVAGAKGAEVHDAQTGRLLQLIAAGRDITAASYSPDGQLLALADATGLIEVYTADGRKKRVSLSEAIGQSITGLLFTPDSRRVLSISSVGDVRIWEISAGLLKVAFAADPDWVNQLQFNQDGRRLLTVGSEGYKVWSSARGSMLLNIPRPLKILLSSAALSPDGGTLVTADFSNNVSEVWGVLAKVQLYSLDIHTAGITTAAFDTGGKHLLLGSRDGQAEVWKVPVRPFWKYESFETLPYTAKFDRHGERLLAVGGNATGSAMIFDLDTKEIAEQFQGHDNLIVDAEFSASGDRVVTASRDGTGGLWDARLGKRIAVLDQRPLEVYSARFDTNEKRIVTTTNPLGTNHPDSAGLWNAADGRRIAWLPHTGLIWSARFDPMGARVVTASEDTTVKIWSTSDGQLLRTLSGHQARVTSAEFSPDGHYVLTAGHDSMVRVWDAESGTVVFSLTDVALGLPTRAVFAPDGRSAAIATQSGNIWLWFFEGNKTATLKGHQQLVGGVEFLQNGELLLSYGDDGTARVWDVRTGSQLGVVAAHATKINNVDVSADASQMVSTNWGEVALWNIALERRSPSTLADILSCQVPWTLNAATLFINQTAPKLGQCDVTGSRD